MSEHDDSDDDTYRLNINTVRAPRVTEKKRLDNIAFHSWVERNQREASKKSVAALNDPKNQSVAHVRASGDRKVIATPREYQIDLFERAKKKNTIVVLDTGRLGSTYQVGHHADSSRFWKDTYCGSSLTTHSRTGT